MPRKKATSQIPQAFPTPVAVGPAGDVYPAYEGMTLRDYFAAQIVGLLVSKQEGWPTTGHMNFHAAKAYALADAMLAERVK